MKWILYPLAISFMVSRSFAWGPEGHRIVAQIAQNKLTANARTQVNTILKGQTLASVANWADTIKGQSQWAHSKPWHFVDIADNEDYEQSQQAPEGDAITAITDMVDILKSRTATEVEKEEALKLIIHFVGDIHQPLHVGRPDDRGGNSISVIFQGKKTNLHSLWDGGMIREQGMNEADYVRYLEGMKRISLSYDIPEFPFGQVVKEDMALRKDIYNFRPVSEAPIEISNSYMDRNVESMNERLLMGGKRLATLLNMIYK